MIYGGGLVEGLGERRGEEGVEKNLKKKKNIYYCFGYWNRLVLPMNVYVSIMILPFICFICFIWSNSTFLQFEKLWHCIKNGEKIQIYVDKMDTLYLIYGLFYMGF